MLLLILGTYPLYNGPLFDASVDHVIPKVQSRQAGAEDRHGWTFFSSASIFSLENGSIVFILANQKDRAAAFYFVIAYVFQVFLVGYLQLIYHRPAPFWVSHDIKVFNCKPSYASPASATELSLAVVLTLWITLATPKDSSCKPVAKFVTLFLGCLVATLCTFGHIYNGDMSIDQGILAALLALWSAVFTHLFVRAPLMRHVKDLHQGKTLMPDLPLTRFFAVLAVICITLLGIAAVIYYAIVNKVEDDPEWQTNVM